MARGNGRLRSLDALRGIAALAVVIYHYWHRGPELYPAIGRQIAWVEPGRAGVQLFFVISGFVIFMTLQKATPRKFAITRFIRLYPTYWICLTITAVAVAVFGLPGREVSLPATAVNYTMLQHFGGVSDVDGAYWTLAAEVAFYVQVGVLFFTGWLSGRRLLPTLYAWLALVVVGAVAATQLGGYVAVAYSKSDLAWIPMFIAGIALFRVWHGDRRPTLLVVPVLAVAAMYPQGMETTIAAVVCVALVAVVLWLPLEWDAGWSKPLTWLGAISYPLYLLHQNIGYLMLRAIDGLGQVPATVAAMAFILALASLVTYSADEPLRASLRRRMLPARVPQGV